MCSFTLKRLIAKTGIAAVLFAQLAMAAHACAMPINAGTGMRVAMTGDMHASMPGCEMSDSENPNICLQHCTAGNQSVQTAPQVSVPAIASIFVLAIEPAQLESGVGITVLSVLLERETSPPPLVRFRVLRI